MSYISLTNILEASFNLRLRWYPATSIEIGSPKGATCSTITRSPGIKPISMSLRKISSSSNFTMVTGCPTAISDNLFITEQMYG